MFTLLKKYHVQLFFILLFFVSLSIRLYKINALSPVVSNDEIYYIAESKTLSIDGKDPAGIQTPLALKPANPLFAELPGLVMVPGHLLFPNQPLLAGRIVHVLIGSLLPIVWAGFIWQLFKNKSLAFISGILLSVNPWFFQNSRMSFDALLSLFFYFLGLWLLLTKKTKLLPFVLLSFFIGFYQYQGLKILLVPLLGIYVSYLLFEQWNIPKKKGFKTVLVPHSPRILLLLFFLLLFLTHLIRLRSTGASGRVDDLIFFNESMITTQVNVRRQQAILTPMNKYIYNDFTVIGAVFLEKYLDAFDLEQLFLHVSSRRNPFAVWSHGAMYLIDLPLIMIGFLTLSREKKWRGQAFAVFASILIAPLPSAINSQDTWQFFRASLLFPFLILLSAIGIWQITQYRNRWLNFTLCSLYLLSISLFMFSYFVRYPIFGSTDRYLSQRVLARYVSELRSMDKTAFIHAEEPYFTYTGILTLGRYIQKDRLSEIRQAYQGSQYHTDNFAVDGSCVRLDDLQSSVIIADTRIPLCEGSSKEQAPVRTTIPSLIDSGAYYMIYNDPLCAQYGLPRFSHVTTDVFAVEHLPIETFCRSFFAIEE